MAYKTVNPFTNETVKTYDNSTDARVEAAITKAHNLYKSWRDDPIKPRADVLHRLAKVFTDDAEALAKVLTEDMGKLYKEALGEVALCADIAEYYATNAERLLAPKTIQTPAGQAEVLNRPYGVLLAVEPWNFPYYQIMRVFAPYFVAGDPMLLKHASNTPGSAVAFEEAVKKAGAPDGSFQNLFLAYDQIDTVLADKRVQGVCLTGSERGGRAVAAAAGKNLKKSTMELGGNDAFIVLDDANMDEVEKVNAAVRLFNCGQVCTSAKRFIVTEKNYDRFLDNLTKQFASAKMGDPMDPETTLAPMCSEKNKNNLQKQVDAAIAAGATVHYGNTPVDLEGQFFQPTILTDIDRDNPAYFAEMFGPVAQVYKVKDEAAAIELANDSNLGLGGMLFCGDANHGAEVAAKIETGMVFVNTFLSSLPEIPFGGIKQSGYGRELGDDCIYGFVNQELVVKNPTGKLPDYRFGGLAAPDFMPAPEA
ncbi:NAD-dependent succinate-semialdehyde dehydrogenase [Agrilactobacillus yilanensis]|uniref:NAD-dependent succinate-semialdehyde dehydrogenase n=1 Tax=Agrilactobacillus yilanensis TaxID=2485997 RepID=A0ABW4J8D6_9LACO|nr:NAD-dependent succinate-semialdehyde dehydrogenase [Agrilactobacillus yilanensis]